MCIFLYFNIAAVNVYDVTMLTIQFRYNDQVKDNPPVLVPPHLHAIPLRREMPNILFQAEIAVAPKHTR